MAEQTSVQGDSTTVYSFVEKINQLTVGNIVVYEQVQFIKTHPNNVANLIIEAQKARELKINKKKSKIMLSS